MKEANYNHLSLHNFIAIQSGLDTHGKKRRKFDSLLTPTSTEQGHTDKENRSSMNTKQPVYATPISGNSCITVEQNKTGFVNHTPASSFKQNSTGQYSSRAPLSAFSNHVSRTPSSTQQGQTDKENRSSMISNQPVYTTPLSGNSCTTGEQNKTGFVIHTPASTLKQNSTTQYSSRAPLSDISNHVSRTTCQGQGGQNPTGQKSGRGPLSDISNHVSRATCQRRGDTIGSKNDSIRFEELSKKNYTSCQETIRKPVHSVPSTRLFHDSDQDIDYESAEFSTISEMQAEEGDLFWDDDYYDPVCDQTSLDSTDFDQQIPVPTGYSSLGGPTEICRYCGAIMWKEERTNKNVKKGAPKFSLCCSQGQIKLPSTPPTPSYLMNLYNDPKKRKHFRRCIRLYNAMFAFTSMGGKVDNSINTGRAPYVYRLNGQNHHVFGTLIPNKGDDPKFCQLYIYDTEHEIENRTKWVKVEDGDAIDVEIVEGLIRMLDETNCLVRRFRYARDRFKEQPVRDLKIRLKVCRSESGRENLIGPSDEVACVMVGDIDTTVGERDMIVEKKIDANSRDIIMEKCEKPLERICSVHPSLMALQYPLLFPLGEDGYHDEIPYVDSENQNKKKRKRITMKEYYAYRFQVRRNEGLHVRWGGRLYQQYVVDSFSCVEQSRLWWLRTHQTKLRSDLYNSLAKKCVKGHTDTSNIGKGFVLPANFLGSKRYMQQNFQDALAVCRVVGHPDIFLTMTCNPLWDEIQQMMKLLPGCSPRDSPDIIARVFHLKLQQLLDDVKKKNFFGTCIGVMYVVEFQKRGLPHVHMLIWLDSESKRKLTKDVDKFVTAEIPDPLTDPEGYDAVKSLMIHGPCGLQNSKSPCMNNGVCAKHFPKKYCRETYFDQSGFPVYKRRNTGCTVMKGKCELDNRWVVPYNRELLVKYRCHMNVEICCHARSLKYLFKYCLKGHDRATIEISTQKTDDGTISDVPVDEINAYFDGRYICASEAAYRIFSFPIHFRSISVLRLAFHLPGERSCTFNENEDLERVVRREQHKVSQLEAFFKLNSSDPNARQYTYDQIPQFYVWNETDRIWTPRKKGQQIGRLLYTHHSAGELWYLRLLLSNVRGSTSFNSLKTVGGVQYRTFQDSCKALGLLDDDNEWHSVLRECSVGGFPHQIRHLFVHIIVNCKVSDLRNLWDSHWKQMCDDILQSRRQANSDDSANFSDKQLQFFTLAEIDKVLKSIGKSLKQFSQLPQPPASYLSSGLNNLVIEETSYNLADMEGEFNKLHANCNPEQLEIFNQVYESVQSKSGGVFFVYGSGGCGKTFVWKTIIYKLRSLGLIVLPVASSGIAATLMPGGRTAHSRFKIPIVLDDCSSCGISHDSDIAELIKHTSLIIWDEAPMQHRYAFECLDRSLRDIMKAVDPAKYHIPFGGITVVLGGDFRQILPVITLGSRGDVVSACITRSQLWHKSKILTLHRNMRLNQATDEAEVQRLKHFADWVLKIGNGTISCPSNSSIQYEEDEILIPLQFCDPESQNSVENMIQWTYPQFLQNYKSPHYLSGRAILTPTNQIVNHVNSVIVDSIPGPEFTYYSVDHAEDFGGTASELSFAFPPEYLNSLNIPGLPPHELKLKEGVAVMLMRNLNQTLGLCNGTRMMITRCLKHCVECEVISGAFVGTKHFIPRMELCPSDTKLPFKLIRKQMPLQVCYSMTINKSQGQSLERVGLYLPNSVFTHGQLYVAISRVTSPSGLRIFIDSKTGEATNLTKNVVFKEIFYNLPP